MGAVIQSLKRILSQIKQLQDHLKPAASKLAAKIKAHLHSHHTVSTSKKLDGLDYALKFSTEITVLVLSLLVIGFNMAGAQSLQNLTSNNLFSKELAYRPNANKLLYNKTTAIVTDVTGSGGFIPSASAQIVLTSADQLNSSSPTAIAAQNIDDNSINQPNPDSVRTMILDQIHSYTVQPGDTLASIAAKFNLQQNTIAWANNIVNGKVAVGQTLQILPTDGVLHTVTQNDTLPDIAKVYKVDVNQIISYNNLTDVNDINPGDILIIPGGVVTPPAPKAKPAAPIKHTTQTGGTVYEPAYDSSILKGNHVFPAGQCTFYVALRRDSMGKQFAVTWGGNAKSWLANAKAQGYQITYAPTAGAIVVTSENRRYGHVALVERVEGGQILVSEMNYKGWGVIDQRWISLSSGVIRGYIR